MSNASSAGPEQPTLNEYEEATAAFDATDMSANDLSELGSSLAAADKQLGEGSEGLVLAGTLRSKPVAVKVEVVTPIDGGPQNINVGTACVMPLALGSLHDLLLKLENCQSLPLALVLDVCIQLLHDVTEAQRRLGLLHGDIKPSNILVTVDGQISLGDTSNAVLLPNNQTSGTTSSWSIQYSCRSQRVAAAEDEDIPASFGTDTYSLVPAQGQPGISPVQEVVNEVLELQQQLAASSVQLAATRAREALLEEENQQLRLRLQQQVQLEADRQQQGKEVVMQLEQQVVKLQTEVQSVTAANHLATQQAEAALQQLHQVSQLAEATRLQQRACNQKQQQVWEAEVQQQRSRAERAEAQLHQLLATLAIIHDPTALSWCKAASSSSSGGNTPLRISLGGSDNCGVHQ
ncbi:hypothetical protein HaLaN_13906 [Haematococcus lacustris]|uniref:Protein kinase domain-containing protein n=1 Tax=Haematococcus lacustris TaxID=44745 RepID=A0A699Z752_HAELA|nr:hypothetical protein HaLaN_13906 [Haematococcus lacustris]